MKKAISFVLTALMFCFAVPFSVSAADGVTEDGICYSVLSERGEAHITGYEGESTVITIPNEIEGYPVTTICEKSFENITITEINFPNALTIIESSAFFSCKGIKRLIFPDSLTTVDHNAFKYCYGIEEIFVPAATTFIAYDAFFCSPTDAVITVDSGNRYYYSESNCIIKKTGNVLVMAGKCSIVPEGVEIIGAEAFCSNKNLDVLELPSSVKHIGEAAFAHSTLREIVLNDGVEYIGEAAFTSTRLESITMTDSVTNIGNAAFDRCYITEINLSDKLTVISEKMFSMCFDLKHVVVPGKVERIYNEAFSWCKGLETVVIPKSVKNIDADAFITCDSLKTIYYCGTEDEWNAISVHSSNSILNNIDVVFEYELDKKGDLDGDGEISASDSLIMRKYLSKLIVDSEINVSLADMNGDGRINAKDQFELRKILAQ